MSTAFIRDLDQNIWDTDVTHDHMSRIVIGATVFHTQQHKQTLTHFEYTIFIWLFSILLNSAIQVIIVGLHVTMTLYTDL